MKYDHRVKVDGKWFEAGAEVNASTPIIEAKAKPKSEEVSDTSYTRTQIQQMNSTDLKAACKKLGIEIKDDLTNKEIKQLIFGKLGI